MNRTESRSVGLYTTVTPDEKALIDQKMEKAGIKNQRAYLRKMAVDGYIVQLDMRSVVEMVNLLHSVASNVNQIARRCNETRNLYADDVEDLRRGYKELCEQAGKLKAKFGNL